MALAVRKNSKAIPVVIAVLAVLIVAGLGYFVFTTLNNEKTPTTSATALDTTPLENQKLKYVQYVPGTAPIPSNTDVGRADPYSPY
jgi:flagellar basal body-associated protein FliL